MKRLILLFHDFSTLIQCKKILLFAIFVTMIFTNIVFAYGFINTVPYIYSQKDSSNVNFRIYKFYLNDKNTLLTETFLENTESFFLKASINDILFCNGYITTSSKNTSIYFGKTIEGEDCFAEEEKDNFVILSSQATTKHTGEYTYITKNGKKDKYLITGIFSNWNPYGVIPIQSFIEKGYTVDSIIIITKNKLIKEERENFEELLKSYPLYEKTDDALPQFFYDEEMDNSYYALFVLSFVFFIAASPLIYILFYLNSNIFLFQAKIHSYYSSSFLSNYIMRNILIWESITMFISFISIFLYCNLYEKLFKKINIIDNIVLHGRDYFVIFLFVSFLSSIVVLLSFLGLKRHIKKEYIK